MAEMMLLEYGKATKSLETAHSLQGKKKGISALILDTAKHLSHAFQFGKCNGKMFYCYIC